jgi:hypothetical protein
MARPHKEAKEMPTLLSKGLGKMKEQFRILRVLEYVGNRDWIDEQIARRGIKGSYVVPNGRGVIREAIIGDVAELWPTDKTPEKRNLGEVLDEMLVHIPAGHSLIQKFDWMAKDVRYKAPEQMADCWAEAGAILGAELGPPESLTEAWQNKVVAIFINTKEEMNV